MAVEDPSLFPSQYISGPVILAGYLRREELARQFGISTRTVDRWEAMRMGPPRIAVGRTILYNIESVREWLAIQERRPLSRRKHCRCIAT